MQSLCHAHLHIKLSHKSQARNFTKWIGTRLTCGSYRVYLAFMGYARLLQGLHGDYWKINTCTHNSHIDPVIATCMHVDSVTATR